ncbi:PhzF family phenazine biosynthesis protein [Balneatrix alpica]|uniref:PhzF family phenazine biosynthesis protein n=1 Tax=Balneatrix alpica TaxID=75684 RepID=A0ABV5ZCI7_9GAMM|nr:PhzF family phenazine biosynthesis protein [Balneatrix alpica]
MAIALQMVDVFGSGPLAGNPLAVVICEEELATEEMQRLTRWFNLSETTFVLPPTTAEADYRLRIFTLEREMPFAGHPTLGSCHAWLQAGNQPKHPGQVVQECGAGLVPIRQEHGRLAFAAPPLLRFAAPSLTELNDALQMLRLQLSDVVEASWIDNGPGWLGIRLASAEQVLALQPARSWSGQMDVGVVGPYPAGGEAAFEVRAFFSDHLGCIVEDPVTGSLNASIAQWLYSTGEVEGDYIAAQGRCLGRDGRVYVSRDEQGQVWIGGATRSQVVGQLVGLE